MRQFSIRVGKVKVEPRKFGRGATVRARLEAWSMPEPNSGCWIWLGAADRRGYGYITINGRSMRAYKESYLEFKGDVAPGLHVLHRCDNPYCINPDHLWLGTHADNMRDMYVKGRHIGPSTPGERAGLSKLRDADVRFIRSSSLTRRQCAERFGVSPSTVKKVREGLTWRHLL